MILSGGSTGDPTRCREYPRPQLERKHWVCLNGPWDFAINARADWHLPTDVQWDKKIQVPFAPETEASGIADTGFYKAVWYRREFEAPPLPDESRLILHFGAVDYRATVWVNGCVATVHEGGYSSFSIDVTKLLVESGPQTVVVCAEDDPHDLAKPRGKQDWQLDPHSIWYPRTTGIWQSVWMERVPKDYVSYVRWTPVLERWEIGVEARVIGRRRDEGLKLCVRLSVGDHVLANDCYGVICGEVHRRIALSDPGIDDYRNDLLWTPTSPTLIEAKIELRDEQDQIIDEIQSYTALRSISVQGDRLVVNGRPLTLRMVLDQGYWPQTGITAPSDDALKQDVLLAKAMGFNGVRKHQKIEDPRFLYWADQLGLLVWEEMPSAYRFTKPSIERLTREWLEIMARDISHPCIIAWVPFNESWGVPDLPDSPSQRHYVQSLYHLTKTLDPTRPVVGNDGWESVATDIIGIHDYDDRPPRISDRYSVDEVVQRLLKRERPGGRLLVVGDRSHESQPIMLTEFGGICYSQDRDGTWGYSRVDDEQALANRYASLLGVVRSLPTLAGFCYTQFTDTYQEANGLLYADRRPKFPIEEIARATRGPISGPEFQVESDWRERLMSMQREHYLVPEEDHRMHEDRS